MNVGKWRNPLVDDQRVSISNSMATDDESILPQNPSVVKGENDGY